MARLTDDQRIHIKDLLTSKGLTFAPLLDELADHITCDIEERMDEGLSYDAAWQQTVDELPEDHFKFIQQETMQTINKRFSLSRVFTYVALSALLFGTAFKTLHLQGTTELVFLSFFSLAAALIASSVSGVYLNRQKTGAINVLGLVGGTLLMIAGYGFKVFHLPGADQLIISAVVVSLAFMVTNTAYAYRNRAGDDNLFFYLHEKHTPGIERFLLILLMPLTAYQIIGWTTGLSDFYVPLILVVTIYAAGLQFIALSWRSLGKEAAHKNLFTLVLIAASFVSLELPMMAEMLPLGFRLAMVVCFSVAAAILAIRLDPTPGAVKYIAYLIPALFILLVLAKIGLVQYGRNVPVNVIVAVAMALGIFVSPKHGSMRAFLIMSLVAYLLEATTLSR